MKEGLRQQMSWLHTWCGLTCGWLLCAIFLAGSLSVFRTPITRWMQAAPGLSASALTGQASDAALTAALVYLGRHADTAPAWTLALPATSGDAIQLSWQAADGERRQVAVDPGDGSLLPSPWGRQTEGGRHFMVFHYMLHAGMPGFWLVGWIAMCALVALVSGIIVHKRIFQDFFTFRRGKGQRSWLDAHNASAVLALPFLLMIVYTGLTYFYSSYMPLPLQAIYGRHDDAYQVFASELGSAAASAGVAGTALVLPDIAGLMAQARQLTGDEVRMILIARPGRADMVVRMFGSKPEHANTGAIHNETGMLVFEQAGARVAEVVKAGAPERFSSRHVHAVLEQLHVAGFGGWGMKWLYFLSGLLGTGMIATGLQLFMVKRRLKSQLEFGRATPLAYRVTEVLNVTVILGAGIASIGFFYANRLIPADVADRASLEIAAYFYIWLASLIHAAIRPAQRAWREQTFMLVLLCLGLPLLNWLTVGQHVLLYLRWHDWQRAGVELTVLLMGIAALLTWSRMMRKSPQPAAGKTVRSAAARQQ